MNRTFKLALAAVLGLGLITPALAQDQFPDIPANHWAYEALEVLRAEGILVGYPDGYYRGARPLTRYELAVALYAAYSKLQGSIDGMDDRITTLSEKIDGMAGANPQELADLKNALEGLKNQVNGMSGYGDAIDRLQKLTAEFEKDLAALGVDVEAMRRDLDSLEARVEALEKRKPAVDIHGDVNILALAGHSSDDEYGVTRSGRILGVGRGDYRGVPSGMTRDLTVLHEAALRLSGTNDEGPKWEATAVIGNMFQTLGLTNGYGYYGSQSDSSVYGYGGFQEGDTDLYFDNFQVEFDSAMLGQNFNAKVGRIRHHVSPYIWQRPNYHFEYLENDRYSDKDYRFDGALLSFGFGKAKFNVFGGRNSDRNSVNGIDINPMGFSQYEDYFNVDQSLGFQLNFPVGEMGGVNLAYLFQDSNNVGLAYNGDGNFEKVNRLNVFGADADLKFGNLLFKGAFSQSNISYNTSNVVDSDNTAWEAGLGYDSDKWGAAASYSEVDYKFMAYGDWNRIGTIWNPTNLKGWKGNVWFTPTDAMTLKLKGQWMEPVNTDANDLSYFQGGMFEDLDKVTSYSVDLDYKLNNTWKILLGYEHARFEPRYDYLDDIKQSWFTVGLGYDMGANSSLMFKYIYSDVDGGFYADQVASTHNHIGKGGLLATQLTIRF